MNNTEALQAAVDFMAGFEDDHDDGNAEVVAPILTALRAMIAQPTATRLASADRLANAMDCLLGQSAVDSDDDDEIDQEVVQEARDALAAYQEQGA